MEYIKTSKGKLVKKHKCKIKGCKTMTKNYIWFGGFMLPICEKHKKDAEKLKKRDLK